MRKDDLIVHKVKPFRYGCSGQNYAVYKAINVSTRFSAYTRNLPSKALSAETKATRTEYSCNISHVIDMLTGFVYNKVKIKLKSCVNSKYTFPLVTTLGNFNEIILPHDTVLLRRSRYVLIHT